MSPNKYLFVATGVVAAIALIVLVLYIHSKPPFGITERAYTKIENGMTLKEVEGIIGMPCGNYGMSHHRTIIGMRSDKTRKLWNTPVTTITVFFDATGQVNDKAIDVDPSRRPGFLAWLALLVGLN